MIHSICMVKPLIDNKFIRIHVHGLFTCLDNADCSLHIKSTCPRCFSSVVSSSSSEFYKEKLSLKMKFVLCFALIALAGYVSCTNSTWGYISPYDVMIHHSIRKKSSAFLQIVSENVTFPFPNQRNNHTITAIRLTDQVPKGKGYAQIYAGGVGFNYTTIHLKSQRNQGYNFVLEIYGRR